MIKSISTNIDHPARVTNTERERNTGEFSVKGKTGKIKNSVINLHPKGIGNGYVKSQSICQEVINGKIVTIGYISNFRGYGEEGLVIHGLKNGHVALYSCSVKDRKEYSVKEIISHLKQRHSLDLMKKNHGKLHIISCYSISNGVCQAFANELKRKVIGYGSGDVIASAGPLKSHLSYKTSKILSVIGYIENGTSEKIKYVKAPKHIYIPDKNCSSSES